MTRALLIRARKVGMAHGAVAGVAAAAAVARAIARP
jgi:2-methylcitrate dehydratase PrpD